jgi:aryl-alcohol dehydrogenase-like predicted oxidoreductase
MAVERLELWPGYTISRLVKGGWHLAGGHGAIDPKQAVADMAAFVEAGFTTFDCADHYVGVEQLIGDFRRAYPSLARQVQIHTKIVPDLEALVTADRVYLETIIDRSLMRLGVDALDCTQFHWWDYSVPRYVEVALHLDAIRKAGKIKALGVTNFDVQRLTEMLDAGVEIRINQVQYSPLDNRPERGEIELSQRNKMAVLPYGTIAGGFISDAWLGKPEPPGPFENRSHTKYKLIIDDFGGWALFQELLRTLRRIADRHNATIAQVAVRWALDTPGIAGAIVGVTSQRTLNENLGIAAIKLTAADRAEIAAVTAKRKGPEGDVYTLERDRTGRHGRIMRYNLNVGRH